MQFQSDFLKLYSTGDIPRGARAISEQSRCVSRGVPRLNSTGNISQSPEQFSSNLRAVTVQLQSGPCATFHWTYLLGARAFSEHLPSNYRALSEQFFFILLLLLFHGHDYIYQFDRSIYMKLARLPLPSNSSSWIKSKFN